MTVSGSLPEINELSSTADPKIRTLLNELKTFAAEQETIQHAVKWYEPKIIATEETKTSTSFVTLTTADEITGVVMPTNGIMMIGYFAVAKQSVAGAARTAIFLGSNQLHANSPNTQETGSVSGTSEYAVGSSASGLVATNNGAGAPVTTGQIIGGNTAENSAGLIAVSAAAGTYAVSVKWKSSSGSVTAKERKLWVYTVGV